MAAGCIGRWALGGRVTGVEAGDGNRVQAFLNQKPDSQESESES